MAQETHYLNASQMVKGEVGESNKAPKLNGLVEPKEPRKEAKSGRYKVADNSNLSQKEMANRMKMMQTLVLRQREIETELQEIGDHDQSHVLSEVLSCIRGLLTTLDDKMMALPGPYSDIKASYDSLKAMQEKSTADLDQLFSVANVKSTIQLSDGYSPHLSSPEAAIRMLISKSFEGLKAPSMECLKEVSKVLAETVGEALAHMQSERSEDYPDLEKFCSEVSLDCIDVWQRKTSVLINNLIAIEQNAPDHKFFRAMAKKRIEMHSNGGCQGDRSNEFLMGFLEKRTQKSERWQRRWFVLSESRKMLYYFMNPDSLRPSAAIPLDNIEIVELVNTPRTTKQGPGASSKIFRLQCTDSTKSILPHKRDGQPRTLTIQAPNSQAKQDWTDAIKKCCSKYFVVEEEDLIAIGGDLDDLESVTQRGDEQVLNRTNALKKDNPTVEKLQALKVGDAADDEEDGNACTDDEDEDDMKSIRSIQSTFKDQASFEDGRTLHLVIPFVPEMGSVQNAEDSYLESLVSATRAYVDNIFKQLLAKIPKAISFTLIDECKRSIEAKISEVICKMNETDLQVLLGKDPAVVEHVAMIKEELEQVKEEIDSLLTITSTQGDAKKDEGEQAQNDQSP
mmetsp:Transcript_11578/g.29475  ORF Transcript_11578/g.29475 Transcript_11578/m.29475 type:complete len:623 (+) Transcript_11578:153-2021(+)